VLRARSASGSPHTVYPGRCQDAGISEDRNFATKPELAATMIERSLKVSAARGH